MISKKAIFIALFIGTLSLITFANSPLNSPSLTSFEEQHLETHEDLDVILEKIRNRSSDSNERYLHGDFIFIKPLAHGNMGSVFEGVQISTRKKVALKINNGNFTVEATENEILVMKLLQGAPNIITLLDVLRQEKNGETIIVIVMDLFQGIPLSSFAHNTTQSQIQYFMYKALETLAYSNQRNIFHYDLHASNILVNLTTKEVAIIDWGNAQLYSVDGKLNYLTLPDQITNMDIYRDMAVFGTTFFKLILASHGKNSSEWPALEHEYPQRTKCKPEELKDRMNRLLSRHNKQNLLFSCDSFVSKYNLSDVHPDIWDLIDGTMIWDRSSTRQRLLPKEVIEHPCFKEVRRSLFKEG